MEQRYFPDSAKVTATLTSLIRQYYKTLNHFRLDARGYRLDRAVLKNAVERYWMDVDRLHRYHSLPRIDRHKIAGYLTYWICRLRPISLLEDSQTLDKPARAIFINELFATYVSLARIQTKRRKSGADTTLQISAGLLHAFLYGLRYRPFSGDTMAMMYYMLAAEAGARPAEAEG